MPDRSYRPYRHPPNPWTVPAEHTAALEQQASELERQASELQAARNGLQEQVLRNEQLKLRLAKLLRERFGASSEKLRTAMEQQELLLGDLEEQIAETVPAEPEPPAASAPAERIRRKPEQNYSQAPCQTDRRG